MYLKSKTPVHKI